MTESLKELSIRLEHYETDQWAADEILKHEIMAGVVVDPCCGVRVLGKAAYRAGYERVRESDIHNWIGDEEKINIEDFLNNPHPVFLHPNYPEFSVFMNPPFSVACEFVEKAFELGARKIVMFQRFAFWESGGRKEFWDKYPPARVYVCGDRATCWRHDIPVNDKGQRYDPDTGKIMAGSSTAHAWFVWERGQSTGTPQLHRIYKN